MKIGLKKIKDASPDSTHIVGWIQGTYFAVTGIWPLVSISSFMSVTGPKTDIWLVKTAGVVIAVTGISIMLASFYKRYHRETVFLAGFSALGLGIIDVKYFLAGSLSPVYLVDACVEFPFFIFWAWKFSSQPFG
jgi:hypothetical protein